MKLFKNPITREGTIRYFELFKVFFFVMFLLALYTDKVTQITGDFTAVNELLGFVLLVNAIVQVIVSLSKDITCLVMLLTEIFEKTVKNILGNKVYIIVSLIVVYCVESVIMTFNRKSVYCVFRC